MICQFSVKNYLSINEKITLDMQAVGISEHADNIIKCEDGENFLPLAVIYGPNGSGKSNILNAIGNLVIKVMKPICSICENSGCEQKNIKAPTIPFKFSKETLILPTEFELFFRTKIAEYRYILHVKQDFVVYENLSKKNIKGTRYLQLYERKNSKTGDDIHLYNSLKKLSVVDASDNITLLSYLSITNRKNEIISDVIKWFENISIINFGNPLTESKIYLPTEKKESKIFYDILREMDIDIVNVRTVSHDDENEIYTIHNVGGQNYELELSDESSGTIKLFSILGRLVDGISSGDTIIIDEFDAKIHPVLLKYLINLFRNISINTKGAQLIFTSHDLATMNSEIFRRDEIWFVAKNNQQASSLYSLVELKNGDGTSIRKDARFDKQYLEGKYGADPYLRKIVNWEDL